MSATTNRSEINKGAGLTFGALFSFHATEMHLRYEWAMIDQTNERDFSWSLVKPDRGPDMHSAPPNRRNSKEPL